MTKLTFNALFSIGMFIFVWSCGLWILMWLHAHKMEEANRSSSDTEDVTGESWFLRSPLGIPFHPFAETAQTPWHALEQRYYAQNKESIEEGLNSWKTTQVDVSLLETRMRSLAASLEVEKNQRRALEDRMNAKVAGIHAASTESLLPST